MKAKQKAHHLTDQNPPKGAKEAMEEEDITPQGKDATQATRKEEKSEDPQSNRTKGTEKEGGNSNVKHNESPEEDGELEQQGLVIYEGPWTKEEQYHYDIMFDELEWGNDGKEPDTAGLVAEMLGADSFEMEIDE